MYGVLAMYVWGRVNASCARSQEPRQLRTHPPMYVCMYVILHVFGTYLYTADMFGAQSYSGSLFRCPFVCMYVCMYVCM